MSGCRQYRLEGVVHTTGLAGGFDSSLQAAGGGRFEDEVREIDRRALAFVRGNDRNRAFRRHRQERRDLEDRAGSAGGVVKPPESASHRGVFAVRQEQFNSVPCVAPELAQIPLRLPVLRPAAQRDRVQKDVRSPAAQAERKRHDPPVRRPEFEFERRIVQARALDLEAE